MCIDYEYLIKRISLFFSFMWYFTLSILPCWQQIFPFYFTSWSASVKNIVTIYNLPVNNLTAGLPASERAQLLPAMKISFMGLPGGKDTFQLEFSQHKALSVSKSCSKAVWEKITQQVCGDAVKITRECRNFPPATGPVWELAARAWQSQDPGRASPALLWACWWQGNWGRLEAEESEPQIDPPGMPASSALGDPAWPSWGRGWLGFPTGASSAAQAGAKRRCRVATATAGTCQHLSP